MSRIGSGLLAALLSAAPAAAQTPPLPAGWERPKDSDLTGANWEMRKDEPGHRVLAEGDYDGDGKIDRAELLINRKSNEYGLFAFMDGRTTALELDRAPLKYLGTMGIYSERPGRMRTACDKGYDKTDFKCERSPRFVDMPNGSISYYVFESGGTNFYWNNGKFVEVWTSD